MARARNIKPGFYKNEDLAECSVWARLIFPGLWMLADRDGRLEDRPKRIKAELLPFDSENVDPLLNELQARGFLVRYRNSDGSFIQISKFSDHQTPHYSEKPSVIKPPDSGNLCPSSNTDSGNLSQSSGDDSKKPSVIKRGLVAKNSGNIGSLRGGRNPLNPSSLNPSSLNPESGFLNPESRILKPYGEAKQPTARGARLPNDFFADFEFARNQGVRDPENEFEKFRDHWHSQPGQKGVKLDWPATWRNWCRNSKQFEPRNGHNGYQPDTTPNRAAEATQEMLDRRSEGTGPPSAEVRKRMAEITRKLTEKASL